MFRLIILSGIVLAASAHSDEIGRYDFTDGTANNQISSAGALPDLIVSGVFFSGGNAIFGTDTDYLALPVTFGTSPFTIYIDATYDVYPSTHFAVSQQSASTNHAEEADFVIRNFPGHSNQVTFYNMAGRNMSVNNGMIDGARHRFAITYDGVYLGNFFDDYLLLRVLSGVLPDIDGTEVRFGDRSLGDGIGATGALHEIRIFNEALSQADLSSLWRPPGYVAGPFNGHYYELVPADGAATWIQARDMAEVRIRDGLTGYLATITTAEEYDFLLSAFPELQYRDAWIGASDLKYPGRFFQWITGESGAYAIGSAGNFEKWSPGEPGLDAAENCVVISAGNGGWLDRSCDSTHTYFLVEYSTQIVNAIKAWGGAGIGNRFPDPEVFAFTVEVGVTDEYYNQRLSPLFASHVVPLSDIPRYFIASAATEPNFDAFLANASVPGFYVYFENTTFNSSLEQVTHGSGSGRITSVDYRNVPVDHIELLIGDETRSEYDPQRGFLRFWWDYTLTFYGPVLRDQNHTVTFQPDASTYTFTPDTRGCPAGYVGKFSFEAQLAYLGQTRLSNLRAYIVRLTGGNLILATTGVALDAGKSMGVPAIDGYEDQLLAPGEYLDMRFNVCLESTRPFQLYIDVLGHEWAEN